MIGDEDIVVRLRAGHGDARWIDHAIVSATGKMLNDAADEIVRLRAELDRTALALIEAQNPGIDMDEVRRTRAERVMP